MMNVVESRDGILPRLMEAIAGLFGGTWAGRTARVARRLQVLETLPLGPKKQLLLISCDGERYLVATGPDGVQTLTRVESRAQATDLAVRS
jgi:flagellar biogenesis protein FliO